MLWDSIKVIYSLVGTSLTFDGIWNLNHMLSWGHLYVNGSMTCSSWRCVDERLGSNPHAGSLTAGEYVQRGCVISQRPIE